MRLIDADKLPATCNVAIVNGKLELDGWIAAKRITEAPTVEAIPIEWLKEWEGYEQDMAIVNLKDIIEYWEKENGDIQSK